MRFCLFRRSLHELSPLSVLKRWDGGTNKRIALAFDSSEAVCQCVTFSDSVIGIFLNICV